MRRAAATRTGNGAERAPDSTSPTTALRVLWSASSGRVRVAVIIATVLSAATKVLGVLVALAIANGDVREATTMGVVGVIVIVSARLVTSRARPTAECEVQRTLTRALLDADVLVEPTPHPVRAIFEVTFHGRTLLIDTVPELAGSVIAAACAAPLLARTLPWRADVAGALGAAAVVAATLISGRINYALQRRTWAAQAEVVERVGFAALGRLELVARGAEDGAMAAVDEVIERYGRTARRGAWGAAFLGRAPIAAGAIAVLLVLALNASYREAITAAVLTRALVLAACLPILFGIVLRASELVRLSAMVGPVLDLLAAPRREELGRKGASPPMLPATIEGRDLTFAYSEATPVVLRDLTFTWRSGEVLVIEGANGAGKSTLLRLVLGLRAPDGGVLTVGGVDLRTLDLSRFRRSIAFLPQRPYLGETHSSVGRALRAFDASATETAMAAALERVGLTSALASRGTAPLDVPIGELSAGQRQRLALARLLLDDAEIYLLDEPDANLDRAGVALVGELVTELAANGKMVGIAAHTTELSAIAGIRLTL